MHAWSHVINIAVNKMGNGIKQTFCPFYFEKYTYLNRMGWNENGTFSDSYCSCSWCTVLGNTDICRGNEWCETMITTCMIIFSVLTQEPNPDDPLNKGQYSLTIIISMCDNLNIGHNSYYTYSSNNDALQLGT